MITGIGIDIVKIERIKEAHEKWGSRFFEKIMTENEIAYCNEKVNPYPSLAVRFAAKEAFVKALGGRRKFNIKEIEVVNDASGRPFITLSGTVKDLFKEKGITGCHVSLSHEKEFGIASVVLEK